MIRTSIPDTPLERMAACLDDAGAKLVQAYFDENSGFAARTFDQLGESRAFAFTRDDLLALTCLDEAVPPETLRWMMGNGQLELSPLLACIDPTMELGDDRDGSALAAAAVAWEALQSLTPRGVGPVLAGKLLARKRPLLVPIVDRVVERVVAAPPERYWDAFRELMRDGAQRERLEGIRSAAGVGEISLLRILDVAIWMRGSGSRRAYEVRDAAGVSDLPWSLRPGTDLTEPASNPE